MAETIGLYEYVTDAGVIIPDTSSVKSAVEETYRTAFGQGVDLTEESVGGRLVERDTTALSQTIGVVAQNANQFNPNYATGAYLDHLANMFGFSRNSATHTRVYAKVYGEVGTIISQGALAKTENGDSFYAESSITISDNITGAANGWFVASEAGSIPCGVGELNSIQTPISGWNGITNQNSSISAVNPTIIGLDTETDAHLRARLLTSVWSGVGFAKAIEARVADVDGVNACIVLENNGPQPKVIRKVSVPPHSVCVCVDGGDPISIAQAIYASRSAGCGYTTSVEGTTTQSVPIPDEYNAIVHTVYFTRPSSTILNIAITAKADGFSGAKANGTTQTLQQAVASAITEYLQSSPMGASVSAYTISNAITIAIPSIVISAINVSGLGTGEVAAYQKYTCGTVTVISPAS